ncbi:hypothetical protein SAMN02799631_00741 [Methylobacterium sp. 174MFSha1.1]|uniref:hypothetical protein n=1 Tax=Methylobacterium sp. 174MFSha1.1 TaxID=1502749 RepID=UPI0008ECEA4D|nr:hypothetical protein [Methylobacterium sp. 174MFSha1.1]SFU46112.1 hypothetical protein SAMN02799631_00741 [Methylobacterium sp. 174MFSha1.1]
MRGSSARMTGGRLLSAILACAAAGPGRAEGPAPEPALAFGSAGLAVSAEITDLDGAPLVEAPAEVPFRIRLAFRDPGGEARGVTNPVAWLRPLGATASSCQDSARAVRVTGRLSGDDVPLAGLSLVTLDAGNRVAIVDPHRPAASRIVAGIVPMGGPPGGFAVHPGRGELIYGRPDRGEVVTVPLPWGRPSVLAAGLAGPHALLPAPAGRVWVAEDHHARLLDRTGATVRHLPLPGPVALHEAGPGRVLAAGRDGSGLLLDRGTGEAVARFPPGRIGPVAAATPDAVLTIREDRLVRYYADSPDRPDDLAVPGIPLAIRTDEAGRWAAVLSRDAAGSLGLSLVDLVLGRRVHGFETPEPFDEAVLLGAALFLTWPTRPVVTVVDLAALRNGDAAIREVRLGGPLNPVPRRGPMMAPLTPLAAVAVMRPGGRTLHTVLAGGGLSSAPAQVIDLKGDPPVALAAYPRSLVSSGEGRFEATARLPRGGRWELVTTTGIGGTTACLPIPVQAAPEPPPPPRLDAEIGARTAGSVTLTIRLHGGPPRRPGGGLRVRLTALDGSDVRDLAADPHGGNFLTAPFPAAPGLYAVSLADGSPLRPDPAIVDLRPDAREVPR